MAATIYERIIDKMYNKMIIPQDSTSIFAGRRYFCALARFMAFAAFFSFIPSIAECSSEEEKNWEGVVTKSRAINDRAAPEAGYGEKTEKEIMAEKPRMNRIGLLGALSGELKKFGEVASNGAELASDEINAKGGIRGKEFDLLIYDTTGAVIGARKGVEALLKHKAAAVVGAATGEVSFSATKLLNENQLILISAGSRRRLGDSGPYNFRCALTEKDAIGSMIDYVKKKRGWKRYALFSSVVNDYSIQLNGIFKAELINRGLTVTHELYLWSNAMTNIMDDERSIAGQLKQLKKNTPEALIFTGNGIEGAELLKEMEKIGIDIPLIGAEDLASKEFLSVGKMALGTLVYGGFDPKSTKPKVKAFVKNYTKKFGKAPDQLAALAYDSYYMLAHAIENAKSMRPSHIRKALMAIKDFDGVTGKTSIGPTGEAIKEAFVFELQKTGGGYDFVNVRGAN